MQGVLEKLIIASAFGLACSAGNGSGYLVKQGNDIDGEAPAFARAAGFPFQKIEAPLARLVDDDKVALLRLPVPAARVLRPLFPHGPLIFFAAQYQPAKTAALDAGMVP